MDKKEIESLITTKEKLFKEIDNEESKKIEAKSSEKYAIEDLWLNTLWEDVIDGRATVDAKKAYIGSHVREYKETTEFIQLKIDSKKREIAIIDDKLKYLGGLDD